MNRLMRITGHSMTPLLHAGELVLMNEAAYHSHSPQRGDLVAAAPITCGGKKLVKYIAGVPGECIHVDDRVWRLGADEYFLLGQCAQDSLDSRAFGLVTRQELVGKVWLRLWPLTVLAGSTSLS